MTEAAVRTYAGEHMTDAQVLQGLRALMNTGKVSIEWREHDQDWVMDIGQDTYSSPNFKHLVYSAMKGTIETVDLWLSFQAKPVKNEGEVA